MRELPKGGSGTAPPQTEYELLIELERIRAAAEIVKIACKEGTYYAGPNNALRSADAFLTKLFDGE
jgi:hypothetical protein